VTGSTKARCTRKKMPFKFGSKRISFSPSVPMTVSCPEAGLTALTEALTLVAATEERWWETELYRLQGELLCQLPRPAVGQAEGCFQQALEVAHRQQARALELRAALRLGRLWRQHGKRAEADALLAPIYGWFTEGFDTADLQEARAFLDI